MQGAPLTPSGSPFRALVKKSKRKSTLNKWLFDQVKAEAKELKNDKLPVSRNLLNQLCNTADTFLTDYNQTSAKAMFLCAGGFDMQISEFNETPASIKQKKRSHNTRENCVHILAVGISVAFESDKMIKQFWKGS